MSEQHRTGDPGVKHRWPRAVLHRDGHVAVRLSSRIEGVLGQCGQLVGASKTAYRRAHPDHEVLCNACLFAAEAGKEASAVAVWFGDIDLELDRERVQRAADAVGRRLVLTPEHPFRFRGLAAGMRSHSADRVRIFQPCQYEQTLASGDAQSPATRNSQSP